MSVDGKIAIVTGAGGGLGKEHALLLASHLRFLLFLSRSHNPAD